MINDETFKALKKAIADAFNKGLPKTLRGKARKKSIKGNQKMGEDLGNAIKAFVLSAEIPLVDEDGNSLLTGATVPPDPGDTNVDPLAGDPVEITATEGNLKIMEE
tara:strand:- start:170 stop:487 length:318 start_codon:yes stop_codon:yes gene_type:complete